MNNLEDFVIQNEEISGFGLAGYRAISGVIQLIGTKRFIGDWPEEITLLGTTYTLEDVIKGKVDEKTGTQFENAEYV